MRSCIRKELAYIIDHSGARVAFVTADLRRGVVECRGRCRRGHPIIDVASRDYAALASAEPMAMTQSEPDDLAWLLHQRHDRPAQGGHADDPRSAGDGDERFPRRRSAVPGRLDHPRGTHVARLGPLHDPARRAGEQRR